MEFDPAARRDMAARCTVRVRLLSADVPGRPVRSAISGLGVPALGTMAHSWVQLFESELEAFRAYAREYPQNCVLLVDTYNVLKSGVPNAIRVLTRC